MVGIAGPREATALWAALVLRVVVGGAVGYWLTGLTLWVPVGAAASGGLPLVYDYFAMKHADDAEVSQP